jgi:N utilization substance protein A
MSNVKLDTQSIRYIALFEGMTGASVKDCIADEQSSTVIFIIKEGEMGRAIGASGENIKKVRRRIGKRIKVVQYSDDVQTFICNLLHPIKVKDINIQEDTHGEKVAEVKLESQRDRPAIIGRRGARIKKLTQIAQRHHPISKIVVK